MADAFDLFFMHQLGHPLLERFFIHLVGQFIHDDGLALALVDVFEMAPGPHHHPATPGAVAFFDSRDAINDARRREVRGWNDFHQVINAGFRLLEQVQAGIDHFVQVVRRNVGGHAHRNAG